MSDIKSGGPAFPDPGRAQSAKQRESLTDTGMTLRDYFAAKAIQGMLANPDNCELFNYEMAERAYNVADLMIIQRRKP